jgi:hypothetical protein
VSFCFQTSRTASSLKMRTMIGDDFVMPFADMKLRTSSGIGALAFRASTSLVSQPANAAAQATVAASTVRRNTIPDSLGKIIDPRL